LVNVSREIAAGEKKMSLTTETVLAIQEVERRIARLESMFAPLPADWVPVYPPAEELVSVAEKAAKAAKAEKPNVDVSGGVIVVKEITPEAKPEPQVEARASTPKPVMPTKPSGPPKPQYVPPQVQKPSGAPVKKAGPPPKLQPVKVK
jgi:hypothetical protein